MSRKELQHLVINPVDLNGQKESKTPDFITAEDIPVKSFLSKQDTPIIRASCARGAYGIWYAMHTLVKLIRKGMSRSTRVLW